MIVFLIIIWVAYGFLAYAVTCSHRKTRLKYMKEKGMWRTRLLMDLFGVSFILFTVLLITLELGIHDVPPMVPDSHPIIKACDYITDSLEMIITLPILIVWIAWELFSAMFLGKEFAGGGLK